MWSLFLQEHKPPRHHHSTSPAFGSPRESPEPPWLQKFLRGNSSTSPFLEGLDLIPYLVSGVTSPSHVEDGESPSQVAFFYDPLGPQGQPYTVQSHSLRGMFKEFWIVQLLLNLTASASQFPAAGHTTPHPFHPHQSFSPDNSLGAAWAGSSHARGVSKPRQEY